VFAKSLKNAIEVPLPSDKHVVAALPPDSAVRLSLTGAYSFLKSGGYASVSMSSLRRPQRTTIVVIGLVWLGIFHFFELGALGQKRQTPPGGRVAVVADERLAALRSVPEPQARLLRRLSRGRLVSIRGARRSRDGLVFYHVVVTRRTSGWLQSEAVIASWRPGDDQRLLRLIGGADEFDRVVRARIFLDAFHRSSLRPQVLLLYGDAAEEAAAKLSREAERRFERRELPAGGAPEFSYYLNYSGLDRYNRQGVTFTFDRAARRFHYDGAAWREIVQRYPNSPEAFEARRRLEAHSSTLTK
jgi:hypothetical protein